MANEQARAGVPLSGAFISDRKSRLRICFPVKNSKGGKRALKPAH